MACCVAIGCSNRPERKIPGITFHRFPSDIPRRHEWIKNVRRQEWMPSKHSRLCSKHFTDNQFDRTSMQCVRLKPYAVPTIFDYFSSHQKDEKKTKKVPAKHLGKEDYVEPLSVSLLDTVKDDTNIKRKRTRRLPSKHKMTEEYILPSSEPETVDSEKEDTNIEKNKTRELPIKCLTTEECILLSSECQSLCTKQEDTNIEKKKPGKPRAKHIIAEEYILPTSGPETLDDEREDTDIKETTSLKLPSKGIKAKEYILPSSEPETMDSEKEDTDIEQKNRKELPVKSHMTEECILPTSQPAIVYIKKENISTEDSTESEELPTKEEYKRKLEEAECNKIYLKKKIKILQQQSRRQKRQITNLKALLAEYKKRKLTPSTIAPKISSPTEVNDESLSQKLTKGANVVILRYMLPN